MNPSVAILLTITLALATVQCQKRELVDKEFCSSECFDDNHECYRSTNEKGSESYECARAYCKSAPSCGFGYKCRERTNPCFTSGSDCQEFDCVLDESLNLPSSGKNPCVPNPCGPYKACAAYPKFCFRAPCPHYACFGIL